MRRKAITGKTIDRMFPYAAIGTTFLLLAIVMMTLPNAPQATIFLKIAQEISSTANWKSGVPQITSTPTPAQTQPTVPDFKTTLWSYSDDCSYSGFLGSCSPQKYIMPDNEVVKYYGRYLDIDNNGALTWTDNNPFGYAGTFTNTYVRGKDLYGSDYYWANPDWYLTHGMKGDCSGSAFAVASVLEAKGVRTKIIGGYLTQNGQKLRDWAVEYKIGGVYYIYFGGVANAGFTPRGMFEQYKQLHNIDFEPVLMFDRNSGYGDYNANW